MRPGPCCLPILLLDDELGLCLLVGRQEAGLPPGQGSARASAVSRRLHPRRDELPAAGFGFGGASTPAASSAGFGFGGSPFGASSQPFGTFGQPSSAPFGAVSGGFGASPSPNPFGAASSTAFTGGLNPKPFTGGHVSRQGLRGGQACTPAAHGHTDRSLVVLEGGTQPRLDPVVLLPPDFKPLRPKPRS